MKSINEQPVALWRKALAYGLMGWLVWQPVMPAFAAGITVAEGNTRTDQAGNGVPVVNIATPNQAGISHNKYNDFNVGQQGLILNNATGKLTQTQLGGLIQNNPNLTAGQEAKGIINEVVSSNPSQLNGYMEVAGKAANVMVANPYGITCNGCGFLNTPNATLTTGKPVLNADGSLQSLDVTQGAITVEGQGLDARTSDSFSLISRAAQINAGLYARDLNVTLGASRVDAQGNATPISGAGVPSVAIDTGALGGMYANRIHLVSSDKGVGVNLGNLNASVGDMQIDASGRLTLSNATSTGKLTANAQAIALNGTQQAGGDMALNSQGQLAIQGSQVTSGGNMTLAADQLNSGNTAQVSAAGNIHATAGNGSQWQGKLTAGKDLQLNTGDLTNNGLIAANGNARITTQRLTNTGTLQAQGTQDLQATTLDNSGVVQASGALTLTAGETQLGGLLSTDNQLTGRFGQLSTLAGSQIQSGTDADIGVQGSAVLGGNVRAGQNLRLSSGSLSSASSAKLYAVGNVQANAGNNGVWNGSLTAGGNLGVSAGDMTNNGTLAASGNTQLNVGSLSTTGDSTITSAGALSLTADDAQLGGLISTDNLLTGRFGELTTLAGSQLQSGTDADVQATGKAIVGLSFGVGSGSAGLSIFASVNGAKGNDKGNGTRWSETTLDSGGNVTLNSGRDTTLSGAQVNGNKVVVDAGRDLTITSLQDSDDYKSKQTSFGAGGSFTFGSMSGSGYINLSQDKMNSTYESVVEQSGIYAGQDGFDIHVGDHTQLNGGVIASQGMADKNLLDTGTLGFSDIGNEADYKVSHSGISLSGGNGASVMSNAMSNVGNVLAGLNGKGHADGTTQSAVADGTIIVRDTANQQQSVADLSRDTDHANGSISPIFDKEKEQKRLQASQLVGEIAGQMTEIVNTYGDIQALKDLGGVPEGMSANDRESYLKTLRNSDAYQAEIRNYGIGSNNQMVVQALSGVLQGIVSGNISGAIAGGISPLIAREIKSHTLNEDGTTNVAANAMAHAVWGAVAAQMSGGNAAAGAAGAFSGELAARYIAEYYYHATTQADIDKLSQSDRQEISLLSTLAAGVAGATAGNNLSSATTGAQAGKNAVENNALALGSTASALNAAISGAIGNGSQQQQDNKEDQGAGYTCEGTREQCAVRDGTRGPGHTELPIEDKDPTGGKLENPAPAESTATTLTTPDQSDKNGASHTGNTDGAPSTAGNTTTTPIPDGPNKDDLAYLAGEYQPNKGAVSNMGELLKQPGFGSTVKDNTQKTNQQYQGQSVYKATDDIGDYIKKGDQFYLDGQHKNHLEIFDKRGNFRSVLNLDGTINQTKTDAAKGRKL